MNIPLNTDTSHAASTAPNNLSLEVVGHTLFGEHWQADLSRELGLSSTRRVREWRRNAKAIPEGVWRDLARLLSTRMSNIRCALNDLETKLNGLSC